MSLMKVCDVMAVVRCCTQETLRENRIRNQQVIAEDKALAELIRIDLYERDAPSSAQRIRSP